MNRSELVTTLELTSRALADHNLVPIFQCFMFGGKTVTAYNDQLGVVAPCETDEAFAVNGQVLLNLLRNSHSEDVLFKIEGRDVVVKAGRSTFKLPWFPEEDFLFEEPTEEFKISLPISEDLLAGISACLLTSSKDEATQQALAGVSVHPAKQVLLFSSDGDAITRYTTKTKATAGEPLLLPNSFCETVLKVIAETKAENGKLEINDDWGSASIGDFKVYGRVIKPSEPIDFADWIKKTSKGELAYVKVPEGLNEALSRARVVADPESAKTVLTVEGGRLKLLTDTHMGVVRDSIAFKHPVVEADVSAALVQRSLALCDEIMIQAGCCVLRNGNSLLQLLSNLG